MKSAFKSAGFLIKSRDKYLLGHSTVKFGAKVPQFDGNWTIFKGMVDEGEDCWNGTLGG
jgi:hypothetical protein